MRSKNCLIAWVILLLVYVLLLTSQVAARELDPLFRQKIAAKELSGRQTANPSFYRGHFRELWNVDPS
ncbi:hypothetical protein LWI28_014347 [Acer negundo]|uniref:Uncharacterized protein n=1 Tax=Acer negundo TaxID=4023 RepID=A0AAD5NIQ8_ACENE|nr:hypothetical protein LWI28_014347 [Acer negundo]